MIPPSLITAGAAAAAAGKNPWLPFGVLFAVAVLPEVPSFVMEPGLHRGLHGLWPFEVHLALAIAFIVLALLDSLADKVSWIERWLTPLSTLWRPFAAIGVSFLIAHAVASGEDVSALPALARVDSPAPSAPVNVLGVALGPSSNVLAASGAGLFAVTLLVGAVFGVLATIGKVGTRLLLALLPLPHLRLAHSILDDVFAVCVTLIGIWASQGPLSWLAVVAGAAYLLLGVVAGPVLARLTLIQLRAGIGALRKVLRSLTGAPPRKPQAPRWVARALALDRGDRGDAALLPVYAYHAPVVGWCRAGYLVFQRDALAFAARGLRRARVLSIPLARLSRVGLAQAAESRQLVVVERLPDGGAREVVLGLFPGLERDVLEPIERGVLAAGLERVRVDTRSARQGLPGYSAAADARRYVSAEHAGDLNVQGTVTVLAAAAVGIATLGTYIPIGAGYLFSPFKRRFVFGLAISAYLALCAFTGFGLPLAILYGLMLNALALRDLTRQALKARVDGYVDRSLFLPSVCDRVWIPGALMSDPSHRWQPQDGTPMTDGTWRAVLRELRRVRQAETGGITG